jgi:hypothetical protein
MRKRGPITTVLGLAVTMYFEYLEYSLRKLMGPELAYEYGSAASTPDPFIQRVGWLAMLLIFSGLFLWAIDFARSRKRRAT